jgi:hypothetical protein
MVALLYIMYTERCMARDVKGTVGHLAAKAFKWSPNICERNLCFALKRVGRPWK